MSPDIKKIIIVLHIVQDVVLIWLYRTLCNTFFILIVLIVYPHCCTVHFVESL